MQWPTPEERNEGWRLPTRINYWRINPAGGMVALAIAQSGKADAAELTGTLGQSLVVLTLAASFVSNEIQPKSIYSWGRMMLSEGVLEKLVRNTPLQRELVTLAWPSLNVESKLAVIEAIQCSSFSPWTPPWLTDLAIADSSEIVRVWGICHSYLPGDPKPGFEALAADSEDRARTERVKADANSWIRACANKGSLFEYDWLTEMKQSDRLFRIRNLSSVAYSEFLRWLESAIARGMPDRELADCTREFVAHPMVRKSMLPSEVDDWHDHSVRRDVIAHGWQLVGKAGPALQKLLCFALPLRIDSTTTVKAENMAILPEPVLAKVIERMFWEGLHVELQALVSLVQLTPEKFGEEVHKAIARDDDICPPSNAERHRASQILRTDRSSSMLEEVLELRETVARLSEKLEVLHLAIREKKGFMW